MASRVARSIAGEMNGLFQTFLANQAFLILTSSDPQYRVWASVLYNEQGIIQPLDAHTLTVHAHPDGDDPLQAGLAIGSAVGLLTMEFATRHRVRVNGTVIAVSEQGFTVSVKQAYSNCPKYIVRRDPERTADAGKRDSAITSTQLSTAQRKIINQADTFFIATINTAAGADASHRGGSPGFVRITDNGHLKFPDYAGNTMFNTLGNIESDPRTGLLFIDFERDIALHLSGTAQVIWDTARTESHPAAERVITFKLEHVVERSAATGHRWIARPPTAEQG